MKLLAPFLSLFEAVGHALLGFLQSIGALSSFIGKATQHCFVPPFYPRLMGRQFIEF